ncbi:hypothetical protein ACIQZG_09725 [Lysinibacillus sp. NPDC096418]|uniref:hypothetical protein n=1 Tax=Lysinibacillus sp. NPDC096418 TaxID=3364138 RepID=UPI00382EA2CC
MKKKSYLLVLFTLGFLISISLYFFSSSSSIDERYCKKFTDFFDEKFICEELILIDTMNGVAIVRSNDSIVFAFLDNKMNFKNSIRSFALDSLQLSGDKIEWRATSHETSNYILGIATNDVEQIIIQSPSHMIPNNINYNGIRIFYSVFSSSDELLPVFINGFDGEGSLIYGKEK